VIDLLSRSTELRDKLEANVQRFRTGIEKAGFKTVGKGAAIVPVMLGDAKLSQVMADQLLEEGIYVIGFFYPVVPQGKARIRVQLSAAHSEAHIDKALEAFTKVGRSLGII
jgi:glycine C-acetyltransferase